MVGDSGDRGRNLRTVWSFGTSVGHGNHVAAFPIELPLRCVAASTDPNDLVFDPFAGSGTTLVAAAQLGRRYFGCDVSPTYVAEARDRLTLAPMPPSKGSSSLIVSSSAEQSNGNLNGNKENGETLPLLEVVKPSRWTD